MSQRKQRCHLTNAPKKPEIDEGHDKPFLLRMCTSEDRSLLTHVEIFISALLCYAKISIIMLVDLGTQDQRNDWKDFLIKIFFLRIGKASQLPFLMELCRHRIVSLESDFTMTLRKLCCLASIQTSNITIALATETLGALIVVLLPTTKIAYLITILAFPYFVLEFQLASTFILIKEGLEGRQTLF